MTLKMAIGKPSAELVATALWIGDVVPGHEGHAEEAATGTEQAGQKADDAAGRHLAARTGHLARGLGLAVQEHLAAGKDHQHAEDDGQPGALEQGKHADADHQRADHDAGGDALDQIPAHLAGACGGHAPRKWR